MPEGGERPDGTWLPDSATEGTPVPSAPGDRYALGEEIARGGLGRILAAWDRWLDREVAVKTLLRASPSAEARFDREMRVTARLQHPNIVPVFDGGRLPGEHPYLAMRRVHGRSLADALEAAKTLDARMALLPHVIDVANALAYAHGQRVVHRDLKPANVLVGGFGETVVIDWGLAKDLDADITEELPLPSGSGGSGGSLSGSRSLTRVGSVMGTPSYMAPEQAAGASVDARADVYALGAMLYELLAGTPPYLGSEDVVAAVRAGPPVDVARLVPEVPRDLASVVRRAMARDPDDRYADASSFAADLQHFREGRFVTAYDYSPTERVVRLIAQHPLVTTLSLLLAVGTVVSVVTLDRARTVAEAEREEATRLEGEAVAREDALRIDQARRLADTEPAKAIELLAGLSARTPFDGRVRTIFSAAMAAGPVQRVPAVDMELGAVARGRGDEVVVIEREHLVGYDGALRERWRLPHGALGIGGLLGVVGSDHGAVVRGDQGAVVVADGEVVARTDVEALEEGPLGGREAALTNREGRVVVAGAAFTEERVDFGARTALARGGDLLVGGSLGEVRWTHEGAVRTAQCPASLWAFAMAEGGPLPVAYGVGSFEGVCVMTWHPEGLQVEVLGEGTGPWNDLVVVASASTLWIGGGRDAMVQLDLQGHVLDTVELAGAPEGVLLGDDGLLWVGTDQGWLLAVGGPGAPPPKRLPGPVRRILQVDGALLATAGPHVVRVPPAGGDVLLTSRPYVSHLSVADGEVMVTHGPRRDGIDMQAYCAGHLVLGRSDGAVLVDGGPAVKLSSDPSGMACDAEAERALVHSSDGHAAVLDLRTRQTPGRCGPGLPTPSAAPSSATARPSAEHHGRPGTARPGRCTKAGTRRTWPAIRTGRCGSSRGPSSLGCATEP